jgi:hypothetical protein
MLDATSWSWRIAKHYRKLNTAGVVKESGLTRIVLGHERSLGLSNIASDFKQR